MKKIYSIILFFFLCSQTGFAQSSMTDSQVIEFVLKEQKAGTSQAQIVTKLMQRGVDIQQIRRIKKQYDSNLNSKGLGAVASDKASASDSRLRQNNGKNKAE